MISLSESITMPSSTEKTNLATTIRKLHQQMQDQSDAESRILMDGLAVHPLEEQKTVIRDVLAKKCKTNCNLNDANPHGDGDQSLIRCSTGRQAAREIWAIGGDIEAHLHELMREMENIDSDEDYSNLDNFFPLFCSLGDFERVRKILHQTNVQELKNLVEKRFSSMRLSPLVLTVAASKILSIRLANKASDHVKVIQLLLKYGANPYAKDVVGKTVCHYGAGCMAIDITLDAVAICIEAAKSAHLVEKQVEIINAENAKWNGIRGIAGGFLAENNKRIVRIANNKGDGFKEIAVAPSKLRLSTDGDGRIIKPFPPLIDVQDRMGSVCMHEIIMSEREDVAQVLFTKFNASIDIEDADGLSPRSMFMGPFKQAANKVCPLMMQLVTERAREEKKKEQGKCDYCQTLESTLGKFQKCSRCKSVLYCSKACQKSAWNEWHKDDCTIVLDNLKDDMPSMMVSLKKGKNYAGGGFSKPDGVAVGETFYLKIQAAGILAPMMVYDKSRQCSFRIFPGEKGFDRIYKKVQEEKTTLGRKSYFKAFFDEKGKCNIFPNSATLKQW